MDSNNGMWRPPEGPGPYGTGPLGYWPVQGAPPPTSPHVNSRLNSTMPQRPGRPRPGRGRIFLMTISAGVIGALIVLLFMPVMFGVNPLDLVRGRLKNVQTSSQSSAPTRSVSTVGQTQGVNDVSAIAKEVTPSIVNIDVSSGQQRSYFSSSEQEGTGSGVIYRSDGYIITNNHVVEGAQDITVTLAGGTKLTASLVGTDPANDIAVVKVDRSGLPAIDTGDSSGLAVGQTAVAVGSPFGFEQTVTAGIISALNREVDISDGFAGQSTLTGLIQTDASINPGNSGGALCDSNARLIGVNCLIASESGGSEGIGFAIPVDKVKKVADRLISVG